MSEIVTVGLDLAKNVFVAFGASSSQVHESALFAGSDLIT